MQSTARSSRANAGGAILIADDHAVFRLGLAYLLRDGRPETKVMEAESLDRALEHLAGDGSIELALLDISMPGMSGAASVAAAVEGFPETIFAAITAIEDPELARAVIAAGGRGYLVKSMSPIDLRGAIGKLLDGEIVVPSHLDGATAEMKSTAAPDLTGRQRQVLDLLGRGKSNKEIARALGLAEGTVKIHMAAIFRALGTHNRTEAALKLQELSSEGR